MASIERRKTSAGESRWEVRHRVRGREVSRTFRTRADAITYRRQVEHDELIGAAYDPRAARITLDEWSSRWWPSTVNLRASTRARDESYYRSRIAPTFGALRLDDIDRPGLRQWVAELQAADLAPATIHKAVQILGKCLSAAVDDGRLARSPADRIDLPRIERREMRFLTPAQAADLSDAIDPSFRALVLLGTYGGLRLGEMLALRRTNVDLLHRHLDVAETIATVHGRLIVNPPKTRASHRRVPLPRVVTDAFECHYAETKASELVFPAAEGGYVRAELWRRRIWTPATEHAEVAPLRPHDLRHSAMAFWIAAGASPKEIANRAGHTSVVTVLDRYGHLLPGIEDRVTDALDAMAADLSRDGRGMEPVAPRGRGQRSTR